MIVIDDDTTEGGKLGEMNNATRWGEWGGEEDERPNVIQLGNYWSEIEKEKKAFGGYKEFN